MLKLFWVFKNGHEWNKTFHHHDEVNTYINTCGLISHPDIVSVYLWNDNVRITYKGAAA